MEVHSVPLMLNQNVDKLIIMDGEDSKASMASPDLQKQLADLTKIVEMQVEAMKLQSQMMSAPGMSGHACAPVYYDNKLTVLQPPSPQPPLHTHTHTNTHTYMKLRSI